MSLEAALTSVGMKALNEVPYGLVYLNIINKNLPEGSKLLPAQTGFEALAAIYNIDDEELRETVLQKQVKKPAHLKDRYKNFGIGVAGLVTLLVVAYSINIVGSGTAPTPEYLDEGVISQILDLLIKGIVKILEYLVDGPSSNV